MPKSKLDKVNKPSINKQDDIKTQKVEEIPRKLRKTRQSSVARQSQESRRSRSRTLSPDLNQNCVHDNEKQSKTKAKTRPTVKSKVTIPKVAEKVRNEDALQ